MDGVRPKPVPERIGLALSVILFGVPALLLWLATRALIPWLLARGWEPLLAWFLAGAFIFAPLLAAAVAGAAMSLPKPSLPGILEHLRVRRLTTRDWRLALLALSITIASVFALHAFNAMVWPQLPPHPPFMPVKPLEGSQYGLLALWLPFFALNVVGEELWWRGFIQPRQEPVFGTGTLVMQGLLHGVFHASFGLGVVFLVVPVVFSIPWAVQRSRNTSVGIVLHAGINGPGFFAVNLGLLPA